VVDARISALGRSVEVESEVGRGICFRLSFPLAADERAPASRAG
jgi:chemotaxis protein histidine kinase CheA